MRALRHLAAAAFLGVGFALVGLTWAAFSLGGVLAPPGAVTLATGRVRAHVRRDPRASRQRGRAT